MKVQAKHGKVTQNMHGAIRNYRYVWDVSLSCQDKEMLDVSSSGVFQTKSVEERWDLIERIQKNTEHWEIDKGIEPVINYEHD